jgi:DNA-binding NtrC family response regulator
MELHPGAVDLHFQVLLVSQSEPLASVVAQALDGTNVVVRRESSPAQVVATAQQAPPVVLVTTDSDWRELLRGLCSGGDDHPAVVILTPTLDAALWTEALTLGAFDVVTLSAERQQFVRTVATAHQRWERHQLMRQALSRNPLQTRS